MDRWADFFKADLADLIKWAKDICMVVCMGNNLPDTYVFGFFPVAAVL